MLVLKLTSVYRSGLCRYFVCTETDCTESVCTEVVLYRKRPTLLWLVLGLELGLGCQCWSMGTCGMPVPQPTG